MTKAEIKKSHDAMANFLVKLARYSDTIYSGNRSEAGQKHYLSALRLIRKAGFKYTQPNHHDFTP